MRLQTAIEKLEALTADVRAARNMSLAAHVVVAHLKVAERQAKITECLRRLYITTGTWGYPETIRGSLA